MPLIAPAHASTVEPGLDRLAVRGQVLGLGQGHDVVRDVAQRGLGVVDDVHTAQERLHGQTAAVAGAATGGQHVVGAGEVVAQAHRRVRADEDRSGVADPSGDAGGVTGLDLEVLGGIRVDDRQTGVEIVDEDHARLPSGQGLAHPLGVLGGGHSRLEVGSDRLGQRHAVGHQDRGGLRVVLGLGDQVGGDVGGDRGVVGENGDLGGTGLGVDADDALEIALGGRDVDVAGAGHQADRLTDDARSPSSNPNANAATAWAPPIGIDLVDAQQRAGGEHRRVGVSGELAGVLALRRARHRQRADAGQLGRNDVHDHAGGIDGPPTRHVETDPVDGDPPLGDRAAGHHRGGRVLPPLLLVHQPGAADRLLEGRQDLRRREPRARRRGRPAGTRRVVGRMPSNRSPSS